MKTIHINKVFEVQKKYKDEIEGYRKEALDKLLRINKSHFDYKERKYLRSAIYLFTMKKRNVIAQSPSDIKRMISISLPPISRFDLHGKPLKRQLKHFIIDALNYKNCREEFYPSYFKDLGINSCVYCNSQLTITIGKKDKKLVARFQVDHYYPKDDFPFLSICLFNLYPVCASCNNIKRKNLVSFDLYGDDSELLSTSPFKFRLTPMSKIKYLTSKDPADIELKFEEPESLAGYKKLDEVFSIEGIYQTQIDVVEELIIKSQIYNPAYLDSLTRSFEKLALNPKLFKRTLIGNYVDDKDIHKRPMSKMMMDISRELGLIE